MDRNLQITSAKMIDDKKKMQPLFEQNLYVSKRRNNTNYEQNSRSLITGFLSFFSPFNLARV